MKKAANEIIKLGTTVRVSDPCYGTAVWCSGQVDNVKAGDYYVMVDVKDTEWGGLRVCSLGVFNVDTLEAGEKEVAIELATFEVGVDSGQAGIFDAEYYNKYHSDREAHDEWYDDICDLTLSRKMYGTLEKGVVSCSGYGDGGYDCHLFRNKEGQVVGINITFINIEDETVEDKEFGEVIKVSPELEQYYKEVYNIGGNENE